MIRMFLLLCAVLMLAAPASSADFFQFAAADGSVSFTNDAKRVPESARGVTERTWEELRKLTHLSVQSPIQVPVRSNVDVLSTPVEFDHLQECNLPVTVTREWRKVGNYTRQFFIGTNGCGKVVYDSLANPRLSFER